MLASQLANDYQKELAGLNWSPQQLALYLALLPNVNLTLEGADWLISADDPRADT